MYLCVTVDRMSKLIPVKFKSKKGLNILLRSPLVGEGEAIIKVMKRVLETSAHTLAEPDEFNYTPEQEDEIIEQHLSHPRKILIVPYLLETVGTSNQIKETPIGMMNFAVGHRRRNSHLGVFGMSLLPEYRADGIGSQMLKALIDWATLSPGIEKIDLEVHSKNTHGLNLYNKLGFQIEGRRIRGVRLADGVYDDIIEMSLFVK